MQAVRLYADGATCKEIGQRFDVGPRAVAAWLQHHGIARRSRSLRLRGNRNGSWNGGRALHKDGYVYLKAPGHPRTTRGGYVLEHILVAEKMLARLLAPGEIVHHRNEIRFDNRPENLEVMTRKTHQRHHRAKLTYDQAVEIQRLYGSGEFSWQDLARQFAVSKRAIGRALSYQAPS